MAHDAGSLGLDPSQVLRIVCNDTSPVERRSEELKRIHIISHLHAPTSLALVCDEPTEIYCPLRVNMLL
jgi:hypothetical protein